MRTKKKKQLLHKATTFVTLFALVFTFSGFTGGGSVVASLKNIEENDTGISGLLDVELIEKRGEFEKHFINEDGSITAYSYANPIHYQDVDGNWIDIDNTLIRNDDGFRNTNNPNEIRLSAVAKDNNLVSIKQGEYEISWGIQGVRNVQGYETDKPEKTDRKDLIALVSKVAYNNVFENTTLAYTLYSYSISEDIIFDSVPSFDQVTYNIKTQNLVAVQEGNEVIFFSTIEDRKEIFRFKAPFMYDSAFALTYNITVALRVTDGGYRLTYVPDRQWLESEERVYPVTLDPTVRSWQHYNNVEDTHINTWYPNTNYVYSAWLYVGQISGWSETWIKITTMPTIPSGSTITDSRLELVHCIGTTTWGPLKIWELTSYWNSFTLTYNNQWNCSWNYLFGGIYPYWTGSAYAYSINVTNTVKKWYSGTMANWGFALAYEHTINDYNALYSSDHGSITSSYFPAISVTYNESTPPPPPPPPPYAFSVGTSYGALQGSTTVDATTAASYYALSGYDSYYSTIPTYTVLSGNFSTGKKRIQSEVLFFSGHGNFNNMSFNYDGNTNPDYKTGVFWWWDYFSPEGYSYVGINGNMANARLVTFAGCLTAEGSDNITKRAVDQGAKVAVGWTTTTWAPSHTPWLERYNDMLSQGKSVNYAIAYANLFTYLPGTGVKNAKVYGNGNLGITSSYYRAGNTFDEEDSLKEVFFSQNIPLSTQDTLEIEEVTSVMRASIGDFCLEDYAVSFHKVCDGTYWVEYRRIIGGFETNSGYCVAIIDNQIERIIDNRIAESVSMVEELENFSASLFSTDSRSNSTAASRLEAEALSKAADQTRMSDLKEIVNQRIHYYYDIETNERYILVYTDYNFDGTGALGVDLYMMKI